MYTYSYLIYTCTYIIVKLLGNTLITYYWKANMLVLKKIMLNYKHKRYLIVSHQNQIKT